MVSRSSLEMERLGVPTLARVQAHASETRGASPRGASNKAEDDLTCEKGICPQGIDYLGCVGVVSCSTWSS